ncbi:MAG TPA: hypothetical protein VEV61_08545, partial [Streptosporangiaceae bacterium]|nr:hypothetical protein [Streptosporangiaceae bacterium]
MQLTRKKALALSAAHQHWAEYDDADPAAGIESRATSGGERRRWGSSGVGRGGNRLRRVAAGGVWFVR